MMRRWIKDLLKGGADVYELERRVQSLSQALDEMQRLGAGAGVAELKAQVSSLASSLHALRSDVNRDALLREIASATSSR